MISKFSVNKLPKSDPVSSMDKSFVYCVSLDYILAMCDKDTANTPTGDDERGSGMPPVYDELPQPVCTMCSGKNATILIISEQASYWPFILQGLWGPCPAGGGGGR